MVEAMGLTIVEAAAMLYSSAALGGQAARRLLPPLIRKICNRGKDMATRGEVRRRRKMSNVVVIVIAHQVTGCCIDELCIQAAAIVGAMSFMRSQAEWHPRRPRDDSRVLDRVKACVRPAAVPGRGGRQRAG
jgi:hypothetical protein